MKKYNLKNVLLGLGTLTAVATPIVAVVSCGSDDKSESSNENNQTPDNGEHIGSGNGGDQPGSGENPGNEGGNPGGGAHGGEDSDVDPITKLTNDLIEMGVVEQGGNVLSIATSLLGGMDQLLPFVQSILDADASNFGDVPYTEQELHSILDAVKMLTHMTDDQVDQASEGLAYILNNFQDVQSILNGLLNGHTIDELIAGGITIDTLELLDLSIDGLNEELVNNLLNVASAFIDSDLLSTEGLGTSIADALSGDDTNPSVLESVLSLIDGVKTTGLIPTLAGTEAQSLLSSLLEDGGLLDVILSDPLKQLFSTIVTNGVIGKLNTEGLEGALAAGGQTDILAGILEQLPETYRPLVDGLLNGFGEGTDASDTTVGLGKLIAAVDTLSPGIKDTSLSVLGTVAQIIEKLYTTGSVRVIGMGLTLPHGHKLFSEGLLALSQQEIQETIQPIAGLSGLVGMAAGMTDMITPEIKGIFDHLGASITDQTSNDVAGFFYALLHEGIANISDDEYTAIGGVISNFLPWTQEVGNPGLVLKNILNTGIDNWTENEFTLLIGLMNQFGVSTDDIATYMGYTGFMTEDELMTVIHKIETYEFYDQFNLYFAEIAGSSYADADDSIKDDSVLYVLAKLAKNDFENEQEFNAFKTRFLEAAQDGDSLISRVKTVLTANGDYTTLVGIATANEEWLPKFDGLERSFHDSMTMEEVITDAYNKSGTDLARLTEIKDGLDNPYTKIGFVKDITDYIRTADLSATLGNARAEAAVDSLDSYDDKLGNTPSLVIGALINKFHMTQQDFEEFKTHFTAAQTAGSPEATIKSYLEDSTVTSATAEELKNAYSAANNIIRLLKSVVEGADNSQTSSIPSVIMRPFSYRGDDAYAELAQQVANTDLSSFFPHYDEVRAFFAANPTKAQGTAYIAAIADVMSRAASESEPLFTHDATLSSSAATIADMTITTNLPDGVSGIVIDELTALPIDQTRMTASLTVTFTDPNFAPLHIKTSFTGFASIQPTTDQELQARFDELESALGTGTIIEMVHVEQPILDAFEDRDHSADSHQVHYNGVWMSIGTRLTEGATGPALLMVYDPARDSYSYFDSLTSFESRVVQAFGPLTARTTSDWTSSEKNQFVDAIKHILADDLTLAGAQPAPAPATGAPATN